MTSKQFSEMSIRDVQIHFQAFHGALNDAGIIWPESKGLACLLLTLGANEPGGVGVTNEDLAREMGVSVKTMMRQRQKLMDEQAQSKVFIVTYESGHWEDGKPIPSRYYFHWSILEKYIAKRLRQKYNASISA